MKKNLIILFLFFLIISFAQNKKTTSKKKLYKKTKVYSVQNKQIPLPIEIIDSKPIIEAEPTKNIQITSYDIAPEPPNGINAFYKYIASNFRTPEVEEELKGKIVVKFIVTKTGEISEITVLSESPKGLGLDKEAIRVLKNCPNWKPGTQNGKPVNVYYTLPISVIMNSED